MTAPLRGAVTKGPIKPIGPNFPIVSEKAMGPNGFMPLGALNGLRDIDRGVAPTPSGVYQILSRGSSTPALGSRVGFTTPPSIP